MCNVSYYILQCDAKRTKASQKPPLLLSSICLLIPHHSSPAFFPHPPTQKGLPACSTGRLFPPYYALLLPLFCRTAGFLSLMVLLAAPLLLPFLSPFWSALLPHRRPVFVSPHRSLPLSGSLKQDGHQLFIA